MWPDARHALCHVASQSGRCESNGRAGETRRQRKRHAGPTITDAPHDRSNSETSECRALALSGRSTSSRGTSRRVAGRFQLAAPLRAGAAKPRSWRPDDAEEPSASTHRPLGSADRRAAAVATPTARRLARGRPSVSRVGVFVGHRNGARRIERPQGAQSHPRRRRRARRGPHQMRHTFASLLLQEGAPITLVAGWSESVASGRLGARPRRTIKSTLSSSGPCRSPVLVREADRRRYKRSGERRSVRRLRDRDLRWPLPWRAAVGAGRGCDRRCQPGEVLTCGQRNLERAIGPSI